MNKFIKQLCILTLVVIVASVFLHAYLTKWWPAIVGFFFIVSMVVFYFADKAKKKDMRRFTNFYMGATVVKMLVYLTIILIYAFTFKEDAKLFAVTFLVYYLVYSVFETYKLAKKEKKSYE
jgi:hypothetical protein